jgi:hypothetical protein
MLHFTKVLGPCDFRSRFLILEDERAEPIVFEYILSQVIEQRRAEFPYERGVFLGCSFRIIVFGRLQEDRQVCILLADVPAEMQPRLMILFPFLSKEMSVMMPSKFFR